MAAEKVTIKIDQAKGTFTITGKLNSDPQPSRTSGKQLILHTTGGTTVAEGDKYRYKIDGTEHTADVKVNLNIGVDNPGFTRK